jgi:hypothetical protein
MSQLRSVISKILTEENSEEIVLTPEKYIELLKFVSYRGNLINSLKGYRGKRIVVNGKLDVRGLPVVNLGNIKVNGNVDASSTNISSIDGIEAQYISTYSTPYQEKIDWQNYQKELRKLDVYREEDKWNPEKFDLDDTGKCANALFKYLISTEFEEKEPGDQERLEQLYVEKERLEEIERETENDENLIELRAVDIEIEEIENKIDIYDLLPQGRHYRLYSFKVAKPKGKSREEWVVGDEYDAQQSAYQVVENVIDDTGIDGFNIGFIENYIDEEELKDYFRDGESDNVRENLDDFFDEDDYVYSDSNVQERIDEIEELLQDSENLSQEQYDELNEELDELKDSDKDVPEDLIEDKIEELLNDLVSDPMDTIKNYGLELSNFVDMGELIKGIIDSDGLGHTLNNYNGSEDTIEFDEETYYIFQIDG